MRRREASGLAERPTSEWIWLTRRGGQGALAGSKEDRSRPLRPVGGQTGREKNDETRAVSLLREERRMRPRGGTRVAEGLRKPNAAWGRGQWKTLGRFFRF